jgi:hypothetical protein
MHKTSYQVVLLAALSVVGLSGCSAIKQQPDYQQYQNFEKFGSTNVHSRAFPGSAQDTCEAGRRALLSQGYVIDEATSSLVKGRKNFQPDSEVHVQVEFNIVCASNIKGSNSTTVFANAVRDRYSLKKSTNSASVGVGVLGSLSLPFGSTDDALVKVASETIPTSQFYDRFFELVEVYLDYAPANPADQAESKDDPPTAPAETSPVQGPDLNGSR